MDSNDLPVMEKSLALRLWSVHRTGVVTTFLKFGWGVEKIEECHCNGASEDPAASFRNRIPALANMADSQSLSLQARNVTYTCDQNSSPPTQKRLLLHADVCPGPLLHPDL